MDRRSLVSLFLLALRLASGHQIAFSSSIFRSLQGVLEESNEEERGVVLDVMQQIHQQAESRDSKMMGPAFDHPFQERRLELLVPMEVMSERFTDRLISALSHNPFTGEARQIMIRDSGPMMMLILPAG